MKNGQSERHDYCPADDLKCVHGDDTNCPANGPVYLIDGKPHRECDCDTMTNVCAKGRVTRSMQTCGFSRCLIPAPDAVITSAVSETQDREDAARWRALKELAGYYQDGSQQTVKLYQDDALRSCFIEAGHKTYGTDGSSFNSAIDAYRKEQPSE